MLHVYSRCPACCCVYSGAVLQYGARLCECKALALVVEAGVVVGAREARAALALFCALRALPNRIQTESIKYVCWVCV